jgi:hypothetical protein
VLQFPLLRAGRGACKHKKLGRRIFFTRSGGSAGASCKHFRPWPAPGKGATGTTTPKMNRGWHTLFLFLKWIHLNLWRTLCFTINLHITCI